jgi:hypothetical protein
MVAGAADQIVKTCAFAAEDDHQVAGKVELIVCGHSTFVEPDDPEVALLEFLEGADKINNAGDAEVFDGSGARFDSRGRDRSRAALGEDDAVDAGTVGNAKKSTEILRVFNTIKREDQASWILSGGIGLEKVLKRKRFLRMNERYDSLMGGSLRCKRELVAGFLANADTCLAALCD